MYPLLLLSDTFDKFYQDFIVIVNSSSSDKTIRELQRILLLCLSLFSYKALSFYSFPMRKDFDYDRSEYNCTSNLPYSNLALLLH
jgi:hypothetical protein